MATDLKPGDRVRDNRVWTVEAVNGDSAHLSLDGHTRLAGIHYLERVPAAPAAEPEMREEMAQAIKATVGCVVTFWTLETSRELAAALMPIIARHLAERDARIEELDGIASVTAKRAQESHYRAIEAEDRARAAEAALAAERERCAKVGDDAADANRRLLAGLPATEILTSAILRGAAKQADNIAAAIRSRTITAEGADTGSAERE